MNTVDTTLTVTNETDTKAQGIISLIQTYIPGIIQVYYGFRTIGTSDSIKFPCVMVEPTGQDAQMVTTGKYTIKISFNLYFYVVENSPDAIVTLQSSIAESLIKLFSNNALDDISTAFTQQFKTYNGFWLTSEMKRIELSPTFINAIPNMEQNLMRAGMMQLEMEDVILK